MKGNRINDLLILDEKDITDMMSNTTRLAVNCGGVRIGAVLTKKVKALVYLCREQQRQGLELDANGFTDEELKATLQHMAVKAVVMMTPSLNVLQSLNPKSGYHGQRKLKTTR
jgi:hypothetical protein